MSVFSDADYTGYKFVSLTYHQLTDELTRLVESSSSGTLFIHSDCNHAITFTLESGRITAIYFGPRKGRKAIPLTRGITGGSCRFDPNGLARSPQDLPPTQEILAQLHPNGASTMTTPSPVPGEQPTDPWPDEVQKKFLGELQTVLTDHLGPIADLIFEESMAEVGDLSATEGRFQSLIDKLALNLEPDESARFHDRIAEILSGIKKGTSD